VSGICTSAGFSCNHSLLMTPCQAHIGNDEYALVQAARDGYSDSEVEGPLHAEYELLLHGEFFKNEFNNHAKGCKVNLPSKLHADLTGSLRRIIYLQCRVLLQY
jgi:hypothetical protein